LVAQVQAAAGVVVLAVLRHASSQVLVRALPLAAGA